MIKEEQSRHEILKLWRTWQGKSDSPTSAEAEEFYLHLSQQHSDLLAFRVTGNQDKRQLVIAWLLSGRG